MNEKTSPIRRRGFLLTSIGTGVGTVLVGCIGSDESEDDTEQVPLLDHWFDSGILGLEIHVEVANESGESVDLTVPIDLYDGDQRLESKPVFFSSLPDGVSELGDVPLAEIDRRTLEEEVSHYTIRVSRDRSDYEWTYEFGPSDIEFAHER